jgi:hypothetical protein
MAEGDLAQGRDPTVGHGGGHYVYLIGLECA